MKKLFLLLFVLFSVKNSIANGEAPFTIELEAMNIPGAPGIHSYVYGKYENKWLFLAGRTNGLHGMTPATAFPRPFANKMIYVVDHITNQVWSKNIFNDLTITQADPLRSTNLQGIQVGTKLYICGGYGLDSALGNFVTFPVFTVIDVPGIMNAVVNNTSIAPYIKQVTDSRIQVAGSDLEFMNGFFYLVGGNKFTGIYMPPPMQSNQQYSNSYKKFKITETGSNISITDYTEYIDTVNLHRRDLNVAPAVKPDGSFYTIIYGGVFKYEADLPFENPVYIDANGYTVDMTFTQKMSQYHTARLSMFDSVSGKMFTTLFGGISLNDYDNGNFIRDTLVPFIDDITLITRNANGTTEEKVLPVKLPGLLGSNAEIITLENIPKYENNVLKFKSLTGRTLVGHFYGGIRATLPNMGPSTANDVIYKVYVTPKTVNIENISGNIPESFGLTQNYPNPFNPLTTINFKIAKAGDVNLKVYDLMGREVKSLFAGFLNAGEYNVKFDAGYLASGIYFYKLTTPGFSDTKKMTLIK